MKAARVLSQKCGYSGGAVISLNKQIPWGAGLGGGSSDAAITLLALNRLWSAGFDNDELIKIAAEVGSDVPFFIRGGACLAEGRGELLTDLPDVQQSWFVLVMPDVTAPPDKTAAMYKMVSNVLFTGGEYTSAACSSIVKDGRITGQYLYNAFDAIAFKAYPGLDACWGNFKKAGAGKVHLAGSGPVFFTMLDEKNRAEALAEKIRSGIMTTFVVPSLNRSDIGN